MFHVKRTSPVHVRRAGAAGAGGAGRRARTSPSCRWTRSRPNPRQPREVFDEDALAELVTSIKEVGLLQPVVVRQIGAGALRAHHGRAPLAGLP